MYAGFGWEIRKELWLLEDHGVGKKLRAITCPHHEGIYVQ
jgi:hypothetical protein